MLNIFIGMIFISIGVYGIKDYYYYKKKYKGDPVSRQNNSSFGLGIILMIFVGIAFILSGMGIRWW